MTLEEAQDVIQKKIDEVTLGMSDFDYLEFLDWLASEAELRKMAKKEEGVEE